MVLQDFIAKEQEEKDVQICNKFRSKQPNWSRFLNCDILMDMNTEDVTVLEAYLDDNGFLYGLGILKNPVVVENEFVNHIVFQYSVDSLEGKNRMVNINFYYPVLSDNLVKMKSLEEKMDYTFLCDNINRKVWGSKGFFMAKDFPTKSLSGDDLSCRLFKNQVQKAAKKYDFASMMKIMDKNSEDLHKKDAVDETEQER